MKKRKASGSEPSKPAKPAKPGKKAKVVDPLAAEFAATKPKQVKKVLKKSVRDVAKMVNLDWHDGYEEQGQEMMVFKGNVRNVIQHVNKMIMFEPANPVALESKLLVFFQPNVVFILVLFN